MLRSNYSWKMVRIIAKHQPNINQTKDDSVEPIVKCKYNSISIVLYFTYLQVPNVVHTKICFYFGKGCKGDRGLNVDLRTCNEQD